jgi:plastocyanin
MRTLLVSLTVFALGLGGVFFANSSSAAHSRAAATILTGSVGSSTNHNAYVISLSKATVTPGTYQFNLTDYATIHNFDLCKGTSCTGTNTVHKTTVPGTGSVSWTVALALGTYTYQCDAHPSTMKGTLRVAPTVQITSVNATRTLVTVTANASQAVVFTGSLLKGTTQLAKTGASLNTTKATLKLKPSKALTPGSYVVRVRGYVGGVYTTVKKTIQVT